MPRLSDLKVKLFTDGADKAQIVEMARQPWIAGFTTNPSLLKKAGMENLKVDLSASDAAFPGGVDAALLMAEQAKAAGIDSVVFDRGGYRYHGRIAAVATAAREAGLEF